VGFVLRACWRQADLFAFLGKVFLHPARARCTPAVFVQQTDAHPQTQIRIVALTGPGEAFVQS